MPLHCRQEIQIHFIHDRIQQIRNHAPIYDGFQHIDYFAECIRKVGQPQERKIKQDAGSYNKKDRNAPAELLPDL